MNTLTKADVKNAATKDLVEFYNAHSGRPAIKKFADRATAEKRVKQLIDGIDSAGEPLKKTRKAAAPKTPKDPIATHEQRAASIAASWRNEETHAARSARNGCKVAGEIYTSVPMAFRALGLDMKKHQRVRREMVVHGSTVFEGKKFTLVRE